MYRRRKKYAEIARKLTETVPSEEDLLTARYAIFELLSDRTALVAHVVRLTKSLPPLPVGTEPGFWEKFKAIFRVTKKGR